MKVIETLGLTAGKKGQTICGFVPLIHQELRGLGEIDGIIFTAVVLALQNRGPHHKKREKTMLHEIRAGRMGSILRHGVLVYWCYWVYW